MQRYVQHQQQLLAHKTQVYLNHCNDPKLNRFENVIYNLKKVCNFQRFSDNGDVLKLSAGEFHLKAKRTPSKIPIRKATVRSAFTDIARAFQQSSNQRDQKQPMFCQEFTYHDGKFPLNANTLALTWECVELGMGVVKSCRIKNKSDKWLTVKVEVIGKGYEISANDVHPFVLKGNEVRTIYVTFRPTIPGKSLGTLIFKPASHWLDETERKIYLCAYGGEA